MSDSRTILAIYCDGGVVAKNPSDIGGTWAVRTVYRCGGTAMFSGTIEPGGDYPTQITNNLTELLAATWAHSRMPAGWSGPLYSDSGVTIGRLKGEYRWAGIPDWLRKWVKDEQARLGKIEYLLLGGHPNKQALADGFRKDGKLVSEHNVACDKECKRLAFEMAARRNQVKRLLAKEAIYQQWIHSGEDASGCEIV